MGRLIEVVGSLNIDLVSTTSRMPGPGETLQASSFTTGFGGKGANQAVAAARLLAQNAPSSGTVVHMVGAVGKDQFGDDFLKQLKVEGIVPSAVRAIDSQRTGSTVIIVEESSGENRILFTPAANFEIKPEHIKLQAIPSLVVFQLEIPFETVIDGLKIAKQAGKETIFNPAPARSLPDEAYPTIDHLIVNESEASMLSGVTDNELADAPERVADVFIKRGVSTIIITLGSKGLYWKSKGSAGQLLKARPVKALDTTAAGDTFVGAYAAQLARHDGTSAFENIKAAIEYANRAAAVSVTKRGAQASIPYAKEIS